jgi:hypothetical protein
LKEVKLLLLRSTMGWWPFGGGKKEAPDMKAASRVQCYDNRDAFFFCLGQLPHVTVVSASICQYCFVAQSRQL